MSSSLVPRLLTVFVSSRRPSESAFMSSPMGTQPGKSDTKL
jgi:hypothetical protein